jgi:hypothetical protein
MFDVDNYIKCPPWSTYELQRYSLRRVLGKHFPTLSAGNFIKVHDVTMGDVFGGVMHIIVYV